MNNLSRIIAEVDTAAWRSNFKTVCESVAPCVVMPIIKANAYGMGAREMAHTLKQAGAEIVGVSCPSEALELLDLGLKVLILGSVLEEELPLILTHPTELLPSIQDYASAKRLNDMAQVLGKKVQVHLAVDTGMGRFGFMPNEDGLEKIGQIAQLSNIELHGIFSHMPRAGQADQYCKEQIQQFRLFIEQLAERGIVFKYRHIGNSTACANYAEAMSEPFNMIRCGIDLHGANIYERPYPTLPVLSLKTRLLSVRHLPYMSTIGYGSEYVVPHKSGERIGIVAIGYADGFPRSLYKEGKILVRGKKCPIVGIICMDYTMISLQDVDEAEIGDEAVIIGQQGENEITIAEVARHAKTIPYEVMCGLGDRVEICYRNRL